MTNLEIVQDLLIPADATTTQLGLNIQGSGSTNPDGSHIFNTPGPVTFKFGNLFLLDARDNYKVMGVAPDQDHPPR